MPCVRNGSATMAAGISTSNWTPTNSPNCWVSRAFARYRRPPNAHNASPKGRVSVRPRAARMRGWSVPLRHRMASNRPYQAQNDLDDMLRNLQRRLSSIFGRSGGGMGGGPGPQNVNRSLASVLMLIVAVWLASGMYSVDAQ